MISVARGRSDIEGKRDDRAGPPPAEGSNGSSATDAARQQLVRSHLPLVRAMARRYAGRGEEFEDLVQAGSVGLVKASGRFDPSRGVAFATFVAPAVEGEIRRHLHERTGGVRIPRRLQRMSGELRRRRAELAASLGRPPDVRELAAALDADVPEVEELLAADVARRVVAPLGELPQAEASDASDAVAESEYRVLLAGGLRALEERERRIVFLRFHADMTERQIAGAVGISQAHVSRLLHGALTKLRAEFAGAAEGADIAKSTAIPRSASIRLEGVGAEKEGVGSRPASPAAGKGNGRRPKAKATGSYSGRFLVRMPSDLHEQLAQAAEREEVSLNRYVTDALSSSIGIGAPDRSDTASRPAHAGERTGRRLPMVLAANLVVVVVAGILAVVLLVLAIQQGI